MRLKLIPPPRTARLLHFIPPVLSDGPVTSESERVTPCFAPVIFKFRIQAGCITTAFQSEHTRFNLLEPIKSFPLQGGSFLQPRPHCSLPPAAARAHASLLSLHQTTAIATMGQSRALRVQAEDWIRIR